MPGPWRTRAVAVLRDEGPQALRIVITAVVGWQVCIWIGAQQPPVFAAVVPLIALRDDPFAAFSVSAGRLIGVVAGVCVGVATLQVLPPEALAVALVLGVGLLLGMVLRAAGALNTQVAVSGLLVLANPDAATYAWSRLWETGVGVVVTIALAPLLFPSSPYPVIRDRLDQLARSSASLLRETAALAGRAEREEAFDELRRIADADEVAGRALSGRVQQGLDALRFHVWRRSDRPRLAALADRVHRAELLTHEVRIFVDELSDLYRRTEHRDVWLRSAGPLNAVAGSLAAVVGQELAGRAVDRDELAAARRALDAYRDSEPAGLAVVVRHPLRQMLHELETRVPGARPGAS